MTGLFTASHGVPGFEKLLGCALVERLVHVRPFDNLRCVTAAPVLLCLSMLIVSLNPTQVVRITGSCPTIQEQERPKPPSAAFSCPGPEFLLLPYASVNSGTSRRRHGRITHQPQNAPARRVWPRPAVLSPNVARDIEV